MPWHTKQRFAAMLVLLGWASVAHAQKLDLYGDSLPAGAIVRLGTKRLQTKGGFGWTPDGKSLATYRDGTVYFWDLEDGHCRETLLVPIKVDPFFSYGTKFVLSADGQKLICADFHGAIATWNLATVEMASVPAPDPNKRESNRAVALHPDGKQFVTLQQTGELQFRDFATCQVVRTIALKDKGWYERSDAFYSPDGNTLVLAGGRADSIYLLDLRGVAGGGLRDDGEPAAIKKPHSGYLHGIGFLADGRLYSFGTKKAGPPPVAGADPEQKNQLLIWDLTQQPPVSKEFPLGDLPVAASLLTAGCSVAFSADGKTLATVLSDRIAIWDVKTEKIQRTIEGLRFRNPDDAMVKIDPLGRYVAVDERQNYVRIWEIATGKPVLSTERHHQGGVYAADWSPDGVRIATGDFLGEARVWDAATGRSLLNFRGPKWGVFALRYAPDGQQIVLCGDEPEPGPPRVGGAVTGPVRWHAADSGELIREQRLASRARLITPSPDWSRLAVATQEVRDEDGGPPAIRLLDAKTGAETGHFDLEPTGWETVALAWSADGRSLFTATSKKVIQTDAATLKTIAEIKLPHFRLEPATKTPMESGLYRGAFVRHGTEILTAGDMAEFYGWRLMGGERLWAVKTDDQHFRVLLPSPDERLLAAVCIAADKSARLRIFDLASQRPVATFDLGRDHADRLAFSPDGSKLLAGCYDGTALVFDVSDL